MGKGRSLGIVVPGLLGPAGANAFGPAPALPELQTLLARAERRDGLPEGLEPTLFRLFGMDYVSEEDPPVAPVTYLADTGKVSDGWCLRADPVHLQPDRDRLLLFDIDCSELRRDEADALVADIARLLADDPWRLEAARAERWYLHVKETPAMSTRSLFRVTGQDIRPHLPAGGQAMVWQARLAEIEMLLHMHPVNEAREREGRRPVNSLWCWGGGKLPPPSIAHWAAVWTDEPLGQGLARLCGVPWAALPATAGDCLREAGPGEHLLVLDSLRRPARLGDLRNWAGLMERHRRDWFAPLLAALKERRIAGLTLYPGTGASFHIRPAALWRWWRRSRPLSAFG
jgi:hypothetical protein